ncbi:hypothetical protein R1sor_024467 [Riccia sorocarpa]|uniref:CCHC-type domain-containing protein n=1 Tax=Riccia sorocarpa TaxID=122646 RepID=A0ABD3GSG6_9MARC
MSANLVNPYSPTFNAEDPEKIRQIVTLVVHKGDNFVYELAELILQAVGTVLYKELVGNDRGSSKLRGVIITECEEFVTTLEVPITTDFTILVQLEYEGLHLRCFKCGSLDHKAEDCNSNTKAKELQEGKGKGKTGPQLDSEESTSSWELQRRTKTSSIPSKAPQKDSSRITRAQGEEVLQGRNLWKGATSKSSGPEKATKKGGEAEGNPASFKVDSTTAPTAIPPYRPPATKAILSNTANKRKERSAADLEGEDSGHISKQARSREPIKKIGDLTEEGSNNMAQWEYRKIKGVENTHVRRTYTTLITQIEDFQTAKEDEHEKAEGFFEDPQNGRIWAWETNNADRGNLQTPPEGEHGIREFIQEDGLLIQRTTEERPNTEEFLKPIEVITFKVGQGKLMRAKAEELPEETRELAEVRWKDGSLFFGAANSKV